MSEDHYTETTQQSWLSRIGDSIKGIVIGFILFIAAFPLLFWNEGRAVKTYKTLNEGAGAVISIQPNHIDANNEKKLVHLTGLATTDEILTDTEFNIQANALKLKRSVEMYQWLQTTETKTTEKLGGSSETETIYKYHKDWSSRAINSTNFKNPIGHENPDTLTYTNKTHTANTATIGAFTLSPSLLNQINHFTPLNLDNTTALPAHIVKPAQIFNQGFYIGNNPSSPVIGDTRIHFKTVQPTQVSLIAQQINQTFAPYQAKAGGYIELLQVGVHSADGMIQQAQSNNKILTWILRLIGFIVMFLGLKMILGPLSVIADVVPLIGDIIGAGTGIIAFLITLILALTTIAIAWIFYRPLIAIGLIAAVAGLFFALTNKLKTQKQS